MLFRSRHHGDADIRVRDQIVIDLGWRIVPKNQNAGVQSSADLEDAIVIAVTDKAWMKNATWNAVTRDDVEVHLEGIESETSGGGEWLRTRIVFGVARNQGIG